MRSKLVILFLLFASSLQAQQWSTILDPSRAITWQAPFAIPSGSWSQCATSACNTVTSAGTGATAAQINAAIASALPNTFVKLGNGTYNLSSCITFQGHSFVALRGNGPLNTIVKFSSGCIGSGIQANIQMIAASNIFDQSASALPGASNALTLTGTTEGGAGVYPKGATHITVSAVGSDTPKVGTMLFLDQQDDDVVAAGYLQCGYPAGGCAPSSGGTTNGRKIAGKFYSQVQAVIIAACNGSSVQGTSCGSSTTYTISPGIYGNNVRSSQNPGAWWNFSSALCTQCGIENLSIDSFTTASSNTSALVHQDCFQCWTSNVRELGGGARNHDFIIQSAQGTIRDSYFFASTGHTSGGGYGIDPEESSDYGVENNIFDQVPAGVVGENYSGWYFGYNFVWNNTPGVTSMNQAMWGHDTGEMYILMEGNDVDGMVIDNSHGSIPVHTYLRNRVLGSQPFPNDDFSTSGSTQNMTPFEIQAPMHGENLIGNVMGIQFCSGGANNGRLMDKPSQCPGGSPGASFLTNYEASPNTGTTSPCYRSVFVLGWVFGCTGSGVGMVSDSSVATTMMRWGNCDSFTNTCRFVNSEVPTTGTTNLPAQFIPSNHTIPASFVYASRPTWYNSLFGTAVWPPIGPDVTGGNLTTLPTGLANTIPARMCYENSSVDATYTPAIAFDATSCYAASGTAPPTNIIVTPKTKPGAGGLFMFWKIMMRE